MTREIYFILTLLVGCTSYAWAAPSKSARVTCPKIIGDLNTGEFRRAKGNYRCFSRVSSATNLGLVEGKAVGDTVTFSGSTDESTADFRVGKPARVTFAHTGDSNFIVHVHRSADGDLRYYLVNEIGPVNGSVSIPDSGVYYLDVDADGPWAILIQPR